MLNKKIKDGFIVFISLAWIPLSILSFYFSEVRLDIKFLIAACVSICAMLIFFAKES